MVTGFDRISGSGVERQALQRADRSEADSIRRYRQLADLRDVVCEAARRADASLRLELAIRRS